MKIAFRRIGGARRDRTADPLLAKQVLSQLSYSPTQVDNCTRYLLQCNIVFSKIKISQGANKKPIIKH